MMVIAYQAHFAKLPDANGKPIGHSAALMLSQFVWVSEHRALSDGWIECSYEEMTAWGFTRTEQETCRRVLRNAGYITEQRRGERGKLQFLVCGKPALNTAENLHSEPDRVRKTCILNAQNAENLHSEIIPVCGKPALNTAENLHSETPSVSIKDTNTLEESIPPIIPPQGETSPRPKRVREPFVKPTLEQVREHMVTLGIAHKAVRFWNFYESNGWKVGRNPMKDWRAACRTWVDDGDKARGSPVAALSRRDMGLEEGRAELRRWFSE